MTRRLHEFDLELRRLENEREELSAAYKEAEAVSYFESLPNYISYLIKRSSCRVAKPKKNVPKAWLPNTEPSVTKLNVALPSRKKKLKLFGKY